MAAGAFGRARNYWEEIRAKLQQKLHEHFQGFEIVISILAIVNHPLFSEVSCHLFSIFLQRRIILMRFSVIQVLFWSVWKFF